MDLHVPRHMRDPRQKGGIMLVAWLFIRFRLVQLPRHRRDVMEFPYLRRRPQPAIRALGSHARPMGLVERPEVRVQHRLPCRRSDRARSNTSFPA